MFSEAYLVFSVGNIGSFQKAAFPDCYKTYAVCPHDMITQKIDSYVQIIGIIIGMMLMGLMGTSSSSSYIETKQQYSDHSHPIPFNVTTILKVIFLVVNGDHVLP